MATPKKTNLSFQLTDDQLKALKPLLDQTGSLDIVGTIKQGKLAVSFLACQAAFTSELRLGKRQGGN